MALAPSIAASLGGRSLGAKSAVSAGVVAAAPHRQQLLQHALLAACQWMHLTAPPLLTALRHAWQGAASRGGKSAGGKSTASHGERSAKHAKGSQHSGERFKAKKKGAGGGYRVAMPMHEY